jgi:Putative DNA-binding domain
MNPPWKWTEDDLLGLIANKVEENLTLDYKACGALEHTDSKKREISKDVSAFANSAGGVIVYGIVEDKHFPIRLDVGYKRSDLSKEWIEQVINSNIQRRIDGIRINPVRLSGAADDKVLYVVSVPQSVRAPHMAADHRFYKRFNFESVAMDEYEVRDVARRSEAPELSLELKWQSGLVPAVPIVELLVSILNESPEPANHAVIRLYVDSRISILDSTGFPGATDHRLTAEHGEIPVKVLSLTWSTPMRMPIWEGEPFLLSESTIKLVLPSEHGKYLVGWRLSAPRMSTRQKYYSLFWDGRIRVEEHG